MPRFLSATELVNFTRCRHISTLKRQGVEQKKDEDNIYAEKGKEHEEKFRDQLSPRFDIPAIEPKEMRAEATLEAMRKGWKWIYHGWLISGRFQGEVDFLRRVERPSPAFGDYSYEAIDTKLGRSPKAEHVLQLCYYSQLLCDVQGVMPANATMLAGDFRPHDFRVADFIDYFRNLLDSYLEFIEEKPPTAPYPISFCDMCVFHDHCYGELRAKDHVALTMGIRRAQVTALGKMNVHTIADLARFDMSTFQRHKGLSKDGCGQLVEQATAQTTKELKVRAPAILATLPPPSTGDLFFDMESDPLVTENGLEYLFGIWVRENGAEPRFEAIWALTPDEEKGAVEKTVDFFTAFKEKHPEMKIYHYGAYETGHMVDLACRHSTREEELDVLLRANCFFDLYALVKKSLVIPAESLSLKALEPLFDFKRGGEVKAAASSIVYFEKWLSTKDRSFLDAIESYNRTDVEGTAALYDWLRSLQ